VALIASAARQRGLRPGMTLVEATGGNTGIGLALPAGNHLMPGIGVGFIPAVLNRSILDEIIVVTDADAIECTRRLARQEGIVAGVSSGAALHAALAAASRNAAAGKMIVVLLPDTGERCVTTKLFTQESDSKQVNDTSVGG